MTPQELTPQELAALDQVTAGLREVGRSYTRLAKQLSAVGLQMQELADDMLEAEQREFITISANY